jgi:hypothetical protein
MATRDIGPGASAPSEDGAVRGPVRRRLVAVGFAVAFATGLGQVGCATYSDKMHRALEHAQAGQAEAALKDINKVLKVKKDHEEPNKYKSETALAMLERATVLHALGRYKDSAKAFGIADKQLELLDLSGDVVGKIGQFVFSDAATKYKAPPLEKLALNSVNMMNYLAMGDVDGARVEAKRFTVMQEFLEQNMPDRSRLAIGSFLSGYTFERLGEPDTALRYYEEALAMGPLPNLERHVFALAERKGYRSEVMQRAIDRANGLLPADADIDPLPPAADETTIPPADATPATPAEGTGVTDGTTTDGQAPSPGAPPAGETPTPPTAGESAPGVEPNALDGAPLTAADDVPLGVAAPLAATTLDDTNSGDLLVVAMIGRVPYKIPQRIPIGAAVGLAGAYITGDPAVLGYGAFKVVVYPELVDSRSNYVDAFTSVDGTDVPMDLVSDLGAMVTRDWEELKPKVIGAAISRMIVRAVAAEGARAAGRASKDGAGVIFGWLAALAVEGTMVALDKPDTRSWTMLASRVYVARTRVPAGKHQIVVWVKGTGEEKHTFEIEVKPGGWTVLDVTTLR